MKWEQNTLGRFFFPSTVHIKIAFSVPFYAEKRKYRSGIQKGVKNDISMGDDTQIRCFYERSWNIINFFQKYRFYMDILFCRHFEGVSFDPVPVGCNMLEATVF